MCINIVKPKHRENEILQENYTITEINLNQKSTEMENTTSFFLLLDADKSTEILFERRKMKNRRMAKYFGNSNWMLLKQYFFLPCLSSSIYNER